MQIAQYPLILHVRYLLSSLSGLLTISGFASAAVAQITPDGTAASAVNSNNGLITITGGTRSGDVLLHSFDQFSIAPDETAQFANALDLNTLITRVTGVNQSIIDGTLATQGNADIFLLNPNGIFFGADAELDVGGAFIATTADSILFENGQQFSAAAPQSAGLLTINTPIGVQYGAAPGGIEVLGNGHGLIIDPDTLEVLPTGPRTGLRVPFGNTLALLGGEVILDGGSLTASDGRVQLLGAGPGNTVTLQTDALGWTAQPADVSRADVALLNASSIITSGFGGGTVQLEGEYVDLLDGSTVLANTFDIDAGGGITLKATEAISLLGAELDPFTEEAFFPTSLFSEVGFGATGQGGDVQLEAPTIVVADGAQVSTSVFGDGNGGNISVRGSLVELSGGTPEFGSSGFFLSVADFFAGGAGGNFTLQADRLSVDNGAIIDGSTFGFGNGGQIFIDARVIELAGRAGPFPSSIFSQVEGEGNGGDITIMGEILDISTGANLSTTVFGQGDSGAINVLVDQINIKNGSPDIALFPSGILSSSEQGSTGQGGAINLVTQQLKIAEGGGIDSSTASGQNAGDINIQAQSVELAGWDESPTGIFSFVALDTPGNGGGIDLQTDALTVLNGAQIVTGTNGAGNGNDLEVNANTITLDGRNSVGRSGLFANAFEDRGNGGTILIQTDSLDVQNGATINASNFPSVNTTDFLPGQGAAGSIDITASTTRLRNQGTITTSTFTGDQGNIRLESDVVLLRNNSAITTNASQTATGGNITILSDFVAAVPDENSDITANAQQGQGGRIDITANGVYGLEFPERLTDRSDITASSDIGLNGEVVVNLLAIDPSRSLVALPNDLVDSANQIVAGCSANQGASFVATGRGGLPDDVAQQVRSLPLLPAFERGTRFQIVDEGSPTRREAEQMPEAPAALVEAKGWTQNSDGTVALVADTEAVNYNKQRVCVGGGAV